ncbi:GrpB family protein [Kribbella sp. NPDC054772]
MVGGTSGKDADTRSPADPAFGTGRFRTTASSSNVEVVIVKRLTPETAPWPPACALFRDNVSGEPPRGLAPAGPRRGVGGSSSRIGPQSSPTPPRRGRPGTTGEHYPPRTTNTTPHTTTGTLPKRPQPCFTTHYLRAHSAELAPYASLKRRLAAEHPHDGAAYTEAKLPWFWQTIRRADEWAQRTGWECGPSDT